MLRGIRCDEMQGFLLARPQSAESVYKLLLATLPKQEERHLATITDLLTRLA